MRVLILVHPGSACGSANFHLGRFEARAARDGLALELGHWNGGVVVIDGELSDELPHYPQLDSCITKALDRAAGAGTISIRIHGDDPDQADVIASIALTQLWKERNVECSVTGAWFHAGDSGGCVGSVHERLLQIGIPSEVSDHAIRLD